MRKTMNLKTKKQELLDTLYAPFKNCVACPLGSLGRTTIVFGEGNPDAQLMFVGEAPGANEDAQGRPFIGKSGQLLTKLLNLAGIQREDVFITSIVKCRPPKNRAPLPIESGTCKKLLLFNQIKIIQPQVICTLGSVSLAGLLETPVQITKIRGNPIAWNGLTLLPTYHPAYILRNPKELKTLFGDLETAISLIKKTQ